MDEDQKIVIEAEAAVAKGIGAKVLRYVIKSYRDANVRSDADLMLFAENLEYKIIQRMEIFGDEVDIRDIIFKYAILPLAIAVQDIVETKIES